MIRDAICFILGSILIYGFTRIEEVFEILRMIGIRDDSLPKGGKDEKH